jgi:RNA polymerase sigma-70 factor (ECF subfamily)
VAPLRGFDPEKAPLVINLAEASASQKRRDAFESHRHRVFALAFYMTGGELEAEQVLTDTFLRAYRQMPEPDGETVDRSLVAELKEVVDFAPPETAPIPVAEPAASPMQRNVKRPDLEAALGQLPATERMIFLLRDVEGYPTERVAATLELTPAEVNVALFRARLLLRQELSRSNGLQPRVQASDSGAEGNDVLGNDVLGNDASAQDDAA